MVALLLALRADASATEALVVVGLLLVAVAAAALLGIPVVAATEEPAATGFATLRARIRASDPGAPGHRRARAPGAVH